MFYNHIHVCFIDWTEAHRKCLLVNIRNRDRDIIDFVEVGDNTAGKILVGVVVFVNQVIDDIERLELVVRIVVPVVMVGIEITHGYLAVLLVVELVFLPVLFRLFLENGVPAVYLVKCLVKHFLLVLAINPVLLRNLVLVSYLHAQDTGKQVGSVAGLGRCCRLHICWIFSSVI